MTHRNAPLTVEGPWSASRIAFELTERHRSLGKPVRFTYPEVDPDA
ncbi:hypothetical protein ACFYZB_40840 [Streptomyces sp. NPDC001852]